MLFRGATLLLCALLAAGEAEWKPEQWQPTGTRFYDDATLRAAVSSHSPRTWFPLITKLRSGRAITVVTLGSSVTDGSHGNFFSSRDAVFGTGVRALSDSDKTWCPPQGACTQEGSVRDLMEYINTSWPHVNHTLINLGKAGASLDYFLSACAGGRLPHTADLLVFQNHMDKATCGENAGCAGQAGVSVVEQLHHRLDSTLSTDSDTHPIPLVVMSYLWVTDPLDDVSSWAVGNNRRKCGGPTWPHRMESSLREPSLEDHLLPAAAYYGWSALSLRNAMWAGLRDHDLGRLNVTECEYASIFLGDQIHPSHAGMRFMGDALVALLRSSLAAYQPDALQYAHRPSSPFTAGTWSWGRRSCTDAAHFNPHSAYGWEYVESENAVDHATNTTRRIAKPGFVATRAGASAVIVVSTRFPHVDRRATSEVRVHYLTSYEHMGDAVVSCVDGCKCDPTRLVGTVTELISVTAHTILNVTQSTRCNLRFEVVASSKGSKFKLLFLEVVAPSLLTPARTDKPR